MSLDWLCAGGGAQSSAKPFLYETASCRLVKKKFEPTVFPKNDNSSDVFFARAIFAHESALPMKFLKGSSQLEPFCFICSNSSLIFNFSSKNSFFLSL
ncbi:MAG: hypothetical protein A3A77_02665 [Candidatus Blackburnbacteria bacterium RIFCSPLOWO2_01_FULL_40_20]|uniref:Uncharacterized protein n=1 Tax=Candidatus Blackburnbacteria bacterium RIFCSPLOWO2_01_FULL_40_20 TaxID=1797519 RepID=A0A1G1VDH3_9BACT|nr:MAG: hypothetical protein A3A77_02665 [Candidatus Blackburnbacteria bacterium RIFCSPLOWO2_01_FULL_40_20]